MEDILLIVILIINNIFIFYPLNKLYKKDIENEIKIMLLRSDVDFLLTLKNCHHSRITELERK